MDSQATIVKAESHPEQRQIGVDIYRILCCFCITTVHLFGYSDFLEISGLTLTNRIIAEVISAINVIGTNGFIFISGYYLSSKGTKADLRRILSFVLEINFFSLIIYLISLVLTGEFRFSVTVKSAFPLLTQHFWYPFNHIVLLCLSPYLNVLIEKASKKQLFSLIVLLVCVASIFLKVNVFYTSSVYLGHRSHSIIWWIVLYLSAAYCRKYTGGGYTTLQGPILFAICVTLRYIVIALEKRYPFLNAFELLDDNSILGWLATISSFITFRHLKIDCGKKMLRAIKFFVQATLVVYLFQEHDGIRSYLWKLVNATEYAVLPSYKLIALMLLLFGALGIISLGIVMVYSLARKVYLDRLCRAMENVMNKQMIIVNRWYERVFEKR